MTELSSQAQAVLDAAYQELDYAPRRHVQWVAAAALRAVADQVAPDDVVEPRNYLPMAMECQRIRQELLAIAAELEGADD
jgi:hypothetical protein